LVKQSSRTAASLSHICWKKGDSAIYETDRRGETIRPATFAEDVRAAFDAQPWKSEMSPSGETTP